jgi:vitamin B12 transporter
MAREASGSSITVLDHSYLQQNQIRFVSNALRDVPGLAVSRSGGPGSGTQVRIRGAEANQTLVLINGIEANDIGAGSEFNFGNLMNLNIDRIEVLRGAQSALWGSDAMGGVINIITKKGSGKLNGKLSLEGGSLLDQGSFSHQETFNLNAGSNRYNYSLSGLLYRTGGISVADQNWGNTEKDPYKNATLNFKGGVKASDQLSFDLALRRVNANANTDGFIGGIGAVDNNSLTKSQLNYGRMGAKLNLLDGHWKQRLAVSGNKTSNKSYNGSVLGYTYGGDRKKLEYQSDYYLDRGETSHRFTFAAENEHERYTSMGFSSIDRKRSSDGFVLEYGLNVAQKFFATVSGRRDINGDFQNANTYHFALAGWVNDRIRLHGSKGSGIKNPTLFELYGSTAAYKGNANLKPEKNTTWDTGVEYHFDSDEGYVDLTYFHSRVENLIVGAGATSLNMASHSRIKGLEFSAAMNPTSSTRLDASYTYTASDNGNGKELVRRPRNIADINGSYLFSGNKTRLTAGVQYTGKQDDLKFDPFYNPTRVTLASYTLVNLALSHQYSKQLEFYGRIKNLFNKQYEEVYSYGTAGISGVIGVSVKGLL